MFKIKSIVLLCAVAALSMVVSEVHAGTEVTSAVEASYKKGDSNSYGRSDGDDSSDSSDSSSDAHHDNKDSKGSEYQSGGYNKKIKGYYRKLRMADEPAE